MDFRRAGLSSEVEQVGMSCLLHLYCIYCPHSSSTLCLNFNTSGKRLKIKEDDEGNKHIFVYDRSVTIEEIVPQTIKKSSCEKIIPTLSISWQAIHNSMKRRSVDDIRNYWQVKLLPLLAPSQTKVFNQQWTEDDDKDLLLTIFDQDVESDRDIDFDAIDNGRSSQENQYRWNILLKGLGGILPGQRVNVNKVASQMLNDIETKAERYVPYEKKAGAGESRSGRNQFIDIVAYFRKHFQ